MTKDTLSPSVSSTTSDTEADETGQPVTEENSGSIWGSTTWLVKIERGDEVLLTIEGGRGRVSYSRGQRGEGEARFYRNESTKTFDAVLTGVSAVLSDRCTLRPVPKGQKHSPHVEKVLASLMKKAPTAKEERIPWDFLTEAEQNDWADRAAEDDWGSTPRSYYEANT